MRALDRKLLRDLAGMRGQAIAIAFVVLAGVTTFVAMRGIMESLQRTLDAYYREYHFAHGFATVRRAPERLREQLRSLPGINQLETRVSAPVNLEVPGFGEPVSGLLVSVPEGRQPQLNRLYLRSGRLVRSGRENEVLLNEPFADAHDLHPGDTLSAIVNGRRRELRVVGIALSPEHLLQIQPGAIFPDPQRFGVLWMGREALSAAYDMEGAFNDLAFTLSPGASIEDVIDRLDRVLERYGGAGAFARADQPSHFAIMEEFRGLRGTSTMLPAVFLAVAAFLLNIVVTRLIGLQREQIGVLKAFGYTNLSVALHYVKLVLLLALTGGVAGIGVGLWLGGLMGELYLEYYRFPALDFAPTLSVMLTAVALTTGAALLGVLRAVRQAVRLTPAVAMRPAPPPMFRRTVVERLGLERFFDQPSRMILRSLERRPVRAALTVLGIASSCAILIMGLFFSASFDYVLRVQYDLAQREDLTVALNEATSTRALYELASLPGVRHVEATRAVPVRLRHEHREYDTAIEGIPDDAYLRRLLDRELEPIEIPPGGVVLTERLASILGVAPGDVLTVEVREGERRTRRVPVAGIAQQYVGVTAYMELEALNRLVGTGQAISGALLLTDARYDSVLTRELRDRPRVAAITSRERAIAAFSESIERSMLTMTFILSVFAGVIAFGVIYNSARISLSERDRELASLRVLGLTRGEIAFILLGELAVLTLLSLPVGFALGALASHAVAQGVQTDMYQFPVVLPRDLFGLAAVVVLTAALASSAILRRKLQRLDLIGVLKTRE